MKTYTKSSFSCGNCGKPLDFMVQGWPFPAAYYVHRNDHKFRCHGRILGPSTQSEPLLLPVDLYGPWSDPRPQPRDVR